MIIAYTIIMELLEFRVATTDKDCPLISNADIDG